MKLPVSIKRQFGPYILETQCPKEMVDGLNDWVDKSKSDPELREKFCFSKNTKSIPNLLQRSIGVTFYSEKYLSDIGFREFCEKLANYYLDYCIDEIDCSIEYDEVNLSIVDNDPQFSHCEEILYADAWSNSYYAGDYTPIHEHGSDLAGIIILKLPEDLTKSRSVSKDSDESNDGKLSFIFGSKNTFADDTYTVNGEEVGDLFLFPAWLSHIVYPMKVSGERRTFSFNMVRSDTYKNRLKNWEMKK